MYYCSPWHSAFLPVYRQYKFESVFLAMARHVPACDVNGLPAIANGDGGYNSSMYSPGWQRGLQNFYLYCNVRFTGRNALCHGEQLLLVLEAPSYKGASHAA